MTVPAISVAVLDTHSDIEEVRVLSKRERISRARIALERGAQISLSLLNPNIAESWNRCFQNGLDPRGQADCPVLTQLELEEQRAKSEDLRRFAIGEMETLYHQISGTSYMIALADKNCVILDTISDMNFESTEHGKVIRPGSRWVESERGTNGMGTCAVERHPVIIHGHEHYFSTHSDLSCMAAPIFHSDGQMAGILDASSDCRKRQHHTHALIRMSATFMENSLFAREQELNFVFMFHSRDEFLNPVSGGLVSFDEKGRFITGNQRAKALLSGLDIYSGCHFEDLFDASFFQTLKQFRGVPHISLHDHLGSRYNVRGINMYRWEGRGHKKQLPRPLLNNNTVQSIGSFITKDSVLSRQMEKAEKGVRLRVPILVLGETGTGKEVMARRIHDISGRQGQFIAVNCGAIPQDLFEAEMFGYAPGAYTSARKEGSPGLIHSADAGTLFLDEIVELPHASQSALLRFLDNYEVRGVGKTTSTIVDVQIVAATNVDITQAVSDKLLRADLYYRINVIQLNLPPLRAREDFAELVRYLIRSLSSEISITDRAIKALSHQAWPGNLRELKSVLTRLALSMKGHVIDIELLADYLQPALKADAAVDANSLKGKTQHAVQTALRTHAGNVSQVAKSLGVSRTTVYKYIAKKGP
ncbi:MAG: sigma-54-dependent Fis family transcriptional regulator [SAR324 cluster bacterium]|nr:sigma-54-dependent Fis family transcriptional regulator [SAR324 cluster bacterium]